MKNLPSSSPDLRSLEAALVGAIVRDQRETRELLEVLVDRLLSGPAALQPLDINTDGLVVSREIRDADGYLAVGHVWMLPHHVTEPVMIRLALAGDAATIASGDVHFGLSPSRPTAPSISRSRALKLLLAVPDEAQHRIPWSCRFRRDVDGWKLVEPDAGGGEGF